MAPEVCNIVDGSLANGQVPVIFKHPVVTPLIEKPGLDSTVVSHFRSFSKIPFLWILKKIVYSQLLLYLNKHKLLESFQSGFKTHRSAEYGLLKDLNYNRLATDWSLCCFEAAGSDSCL